MILGFKGFKPGLVATLGNGKFQYVPNELNETKKAMCASTGFHYCLDPWDCLNWYTWNGKNEFWAVAAGGDVDEDGYGSRQLYEAGSSPQADSRRIFADARQLCV